MTDTQTVMLLAPSEIPTETDFRAYNVAAFERELDT